MGSATHTSDPPCSNQGLQVTSIARKTQEAGPHARANWPTCAMPQQGCYLTSQHSIGPLPAADPFTVGNRVSQKDRHLPTQTYSFLFQVPHERGESLRTKVKGFVQDSRSITVRTTNYSQLCYAMILGLPSSSGISFQNQNLFSKKQKWLRSESLVLVEYLVYCFLQYITIFM